jgi:hypothetical protein
MNAPNRLLDEVARLVTDAAGAAQGVRREVETVVKTQMQRILADMDVADADAGPDTGQTLAETERVMGLADWIDPETGTLAEDTPVRLEDH